MTNRESNKILDISRVINPVEMAFTPIPTESKRAINRAAQAIVDGYIDSVYFDLVNKWRACHAYPINTFQSTLRGKLSGKRYKDSIVAQRLKRFVTIIGKLKDDDRLTLTTMQDIGGVRAILGSIKLVYDLTIQYRNSPHFSTMIEPHSCKDYIAFPKENGYRSVHIIFKYKNKINPAYDGLRIEMQIRTKLQHVWATAVEVMGTFRGEKLKSGHGDEKWQKFFALVSSAFAYKEKSTPVFENLSPMDTYFQIITLERQLSVIELMQGFTIAANSIHQRKGSGSSFYLISLNSNDKWVNVTSYNKKEQNSALKDYASAELDKGIETVLVSAGKVGDLKKAYPNYFLDTTEFVKELGIIKATVESFIKKEADV